MRVSQILIVAGAMIATTGTQAMEFGAGGRTSLHGFNIPRGEFPNSDRGRPFPGRLIRPDGGPGPIVHGNTGPVGDRLGSPHDVRGPGPRTGPYYGPHEGGWHHGYYPPSVPRYVPGPGWRGPGPYWGGGWYGPPSGLTIAIGMTVAALPPNCATSIVNGVAYQLCGNTWYQPVYNGPQVQFTVVASPR